MQISANGIAVEVDDQGPPNGEAVLLIMGLGMQLIAWPDALVADLLGRGFRVVRFDNRDAGLSQGFDDLGVPNPMVSGLKHLVHLPVRPPYTLADMAADARGVLDSLGIARAHVVGASLGGMVAQHLAARHPERVRSLTLIMTTSGARALPRPSMDVSRMLMSRPRSLDPEAVADHLARVFSVIGSPAFRPDPVAFHGQLLQGVRRAYRPAGTARQLAAVIADGDRTPLLSGIRAPTHIIHGQADPLVPVAAAHELARHIPGATLDVVPGMGHDFPAVLMPRVAQGIASAAERARGA
jgi:pimeloyl-ACP methyl ester carboxylesterase